MLSFDSLQIRSFLAEVVISADFTTLSLENDWLIKMRQPNVLKPRQTALNCIPASLTGSNPDHF